MGSARVKAMSSSTGSSTPTDSMSRTLNQFLPDLVICRPGVAETVLTVIGEVDGTLPTR